MAHEVTPFLDDIEMSPISDFQELATFTSGIESMDKFIRGDFRLSVEGHYCVAYKACYHGELLAVFALSFDSLDLDSDDKEELQSGISSASTPAVDFNYSETFYAKSRYPALDIAYLAVQEKWQGHHIGQYLIEDIAEQARTQTFAGCQFLTVEALATQDYTAVGFYLKCGFAPNEVKKPYKDTIRMFRTLYEDNES